MTGSGRSAPGPRPCDGAQRAPSHRAALHITLHARETRFTGLAQTWVRRERFLPVRGRWGARRGGIGAGPGAPDRAPTRRRRALPGTRAARELLRRDPRGVNSGWRELTGHGRSSRALRRLLPYVTPRRGAPGADERPGAW